MTSTVVGGRKRDGCVVGLAVEWKRWSNKGSNGPPWWCRISSALKQRLGVPTVVVEHEVGGNVSANTGRA